MKLMVDGLSIEWDARKNSLNLKKHGVGFKEASGVFFDENRVEILTLFIASMKTVLP